MQPNPRRSPVIQRSKMMLEVASYLVAAPGWEERQVTIQFREQGAPEWKYTFFASDTPDSIPAVASGEADFAICNPGGVLSMALKGTGPFTTPIPVRAITVFPQWDALGIAVTEKSGITSIAQIKEERRPLKISVRGQRDHSTHFIMKEVLGAYGFSYDDIVAWGGEIRYDPGLGNAPGRIGAVARGEIDALIDEAFNSLVSGISDLDMRLLPIDEPQMQALEARGIPRVVVPKARYPRLPADLIAVDFSGWPVYCLESTPDALVTAFCTGLEAQKDRIPWYSDNIGEADGPMRLDQLCRGIPEAPLTIPLHPAAERFWRQQGYL